MSTLAIKQESPLPLVNFSFYNQRFKFLCVCKDYLAHRCLAIFYRALSVCLSLFSSRLAHKHGELSHYYTRMAYGRMAAYTHFSDELIDFSLNQPQIKKYTDTLSKQNGKGCCFGMTLDFIAEYFRETRSGKSPLEAALSIAPRYREGAPDQAVFAQNSHQALTNDEQLANLAFKTEIEPKLEAIKSELQEGQKKIAQTGNKLEDFYKLKAEHLLKLDQLNSNIDKLMFQIITKRDQQVAHQFHLRLEPTAFYDPNKETFPLALLTDSLAGGAYSVSMKTAHRGHQIAWIKTAEGPQLLFDPNQGTLSIEPSQAAAKIWQIATSLYPKDEIWSISFTRCH